MRILYQPTESTPGDWKQAQAAQWVGLSSFNCHALCVQGVVIDGADHYSVEPVAAGIVRVVVWHDDPTDWPSGQRWAREICFRHLAPDSDPCFGGALNTCQTQVIYAEAGIRTILEAAYGSNPKITFKDWTDFDPNRANPMSGVWVSDAEHAAHQAKQSVQGWRTWTEGLDPSELDAHGCVKDQRALGRYDVPKGTRTYYHNAVASALTPHTGADFQNQLGVSAAGSSNQTSGNISGTGRLVWSTNTVGGEPNSAAWPTTGVYRYQIDCIAVGADLTFGILDQGNDVGHFSRQNAAGDTDLQTFQQDQAAFAGSGLHLASITDPAWTAGSSTDRFGFALAGVRVTGHGNQTITLQLGELDDFTDGPWAAATGPTDNAVFFGTNF